MDKKLKNKFYYVTVGFLIEAVDKESARKMVVEHNFAKVMENSNKNNNGWHNFDVEKIERVLEKDVI
jgi:hydrogenase maturation factor